MLVSACEDERLLKLALYDAFFNIIQADNTPDAELIIDELKSHFDER